MEIKDSGNAIKVDDTCYLKVSATRISNDGVTFSTPIVFIQEIVVDINGEVNKRGLSLSPKQAIRLGNLLRENGKEAYAQRFEKL